MAVKAKKFQGLNSSIFANGGLLGAISQGVEMATLPDNGQQESLDDLNTTNYNVGSFDELGNMFNTTNFARTNYTADDLLGMSSGEAAGRIISNTLAGGINGAMAGIGAAGTGAAAGVGAGMNLLASGIGWAIRKLRAKSKAQELNYKGNIANQNALAKMQNSAMDISKNMRNNALLNSNSAALGGPLDTIFTNGVRFITEGGSHEQNPSGGVPQGVASDGLPNLVEEGEVIYKDYVYSKRLKVPQADKESLGLKKDKEYTYADAATQIQKESEERPNDPISKKNLDEMMARLQGSQEALKERRDVQALKKAVNNMTPEELIMLMQQLQHPQQMQPMLSMQGMRPMQPTQSEVPMFGKGGILGHKYDGLTFTTPNGKLTYAIRGPKYADISEEDWNRMMYETYGDPDGTDVNTNGPGYFMPQLTIDSYGNIQAPGDKRVLGENGEVVGTVDTGADNDILKGNPWAQILRTAPVVGSLASGIASLFDKPNYSNIERAEKAASAVPRVSVGHVGQRMTFTPIDINYLATQLTNQGIGTRRALFESGAGPQAVIASNYAGQTALGDAIMKANQLNRQNLAQALEFNRGTDTTNIGNDLQAALANQQRDANYANFLFQTGQLRDAELARVQANRNANLTNLFNNLGNLGTDMLNREQAAALTESFGVPYNPWMDTLRRTSFGKNGGKLDVKKGGKHA